MCGICGVIGRAALNPDREWVVRKMMDTLRHRGPDDEGLVFGQNFVFGHRRLAVIDLEYGAQPMQSEDGQVTITYNGEIYNYLEQLMLKENRYGRQIWGALCLELWSREFLDGRSPEN